jgi:hypothetical protein
MDDRVEPYAVPVSRVAPENVRRLAYRRAVYGGCPWRRLPLDGLLLLYGGAGATDLGESWQGVVDLPLPVENELQRRAFTRIMNQEIGRGLSWDGVLEKG